ncbi:SMC-Scp complex subunit ScpB [Candidatus Woesearchaeota archaeon]|nr:SMC-Scp complex subunit ScpB [Candidatus Woesearchaeota archaeon]
MIEVKKPSVKSKVEAILFSTGHRIGVDEICKLSRSKRDDVIPALRELQKEYDEKQSSLMLFEEGDFWKFTVRDHFIPMVRKIVTETELTRSVLETLAVIAFKYPILQSDLIKMRTNKAYDHLVELEKASYISRQKHGRTNLIKLTEKFFKYFDLTEERLKEQFKDFDSIAKAIKEKEIEVERIKDEQHQRAEDLKKEDEKIKKEIEALDKTEEEFEISLQTYKTEPKELISEVFEKEGSLVVEKEKIGEMEVIEEIQKDSAKKEQRIQEKQELSTQINEPLIQEEETKNKIFEQQPKKEKRKIKKKIEGIKLTPEMEAKVEQRVEEILGVKENKEENKEI